MLPGTISCEKEIPQSFVVISMLGVRVFVAVCLFLKMHATAWLEVLWVGKALKENEAFTSHEVFTFDLEGCLLGWRNIFVLNS